MFLSNYWYLASQFHQVSNFERKEYFIQGLCRPICCDFSRYS